LVFGSRDNPFEVIAQLSGSVVGEAGGSPLGPIAATVARALRLPFVAVELAGPEGPPLI
jgi:hypothetical protein